MENECNFVRVKGRVVREPHYGSGKKSEFCFVVLATGRGVNSCYHNISGFGKLATEMKDIRKGSVVEVEGRLSYRPKEKSGVKFHECQIVVDKVNHFLPEIPQDEEVEEDSLPF